MALENITPATREEEFLDRIARAAAAPNLPDVDASDNGDVLTVVSGEWAAAAPSSELPEVTSSNNGQVLTVVSGEWAAAEPAGGNSPLMIYVTSFNRVENDPDASANKYYYYNTNITANDIILAYSYNTFKPVYVCIPNTIGNSATAPDYYSYELSCTMVQWPIFEYSYTLSANRTVIIHVEAVDNNYAVLIRLYDQYNPQ